MAKSKKYVIGSVSLLRTMYAYLRANNVSGARPNKSVYEIVVDVACKKDASLVKPYGKKACRKFIMDNLLIFGDVSEILKTPKVKSNFVYGKSKIPNGMDVNSDEFLHSFEWRQLRFQALTKYGRECQCCGARPGNGIVLNVDHVKPRRHFPHLALDISNLQVLCSACNHGKSNKIADFRVQPKLVEVVAPNVISKPAPVIVEKQKLPEKPRAVRVVRDGKIKALVSNMKDYRRQTDITHDDQGISAMDAENMRHLLSILQEINAD